MVICAVIFVSKRVEKAIGEVYCRYNPIASYVKPHLTLLFPLETQLAFSEICAHFERITSEVHTFTISLDGLKFRREDLLTYLDISDGARKLRLLNQRLYSGPFEKFLEIERPFYPHLTLGRFQNEADMIQAYRELENFKPDIDFTVRDLSLLERKAPQQWQTIKVFRLQGEEV